MEWVHGGKAATGEIAHTLYYKAGRSAALSGIQIRCSCGARRNLGGAFNYDEETGGALHTSAKYDCKGDQPWLGIVDGEGGACGAYLRAVQRGGSNVYFPSIYSSIYLPLWGEKTDPRIVRILEDPAVWDVLCSGLEEGRFISREKCEGVASTRGVNVDSLVEAAQRKLDGSAEQENVEEQEYRRSEYEAIRSERGGEGTDLLVEALPVNKYADWMAPFFEKICLVRKLRETRTLSGFSRLLPPGADSEGGEIQPLAKSAALRWLPAIIVRGEGIFIEFRIEEIMDWVQRSSIADRMDQLASIYNQSRNQRGFAPVEISSKFVLIHTFAHLLIRQLSFDCGYGSAALRERIYCDLEAVSESMQGVLIYTAAGDSEGTMGGLVRNGKPGNLEPSIRRAIRDSAWCSSDPVCVESKGQGTDSANLAACHGCALLPETSCEEGNRLLDRAAISGTPTDSCLGFFMNLFQ
jgi:hypothetical protein